MAGDRSARRRPGRGPRRGGTPPAIGSGHSEFIAMRRRRDPEARCTETRMSPSALGRPMSIAIIGRNRSGTVRSPGLATAGVRRLIALVPIEESEIRPHEAKAKYRCPEVMCGRYDSSYVLCRTQSRARGGSGCRRTTPAAVSSRGHRGSRTSSRQRPRSDRAALTGIGLGARPEQVPAEGEQPGMPTAGPRRPGRPGKASISALDVARHQVPHHRDDPLGPHREHRQGQGVVAREDRQVRPVQQLADLIERTATPPSPPRSAPASPAAPPSPARRSGPSARGCCRAPSAGRPHSAIAAKWRYNPS